MESVETARERLLRDLEAMTTVSTSAEAFARNVSAAIEHWRTKNFANLADFCRASGVSRNTVKSLMKSGISPGSDRHQTVRKIADTLGVDPASLWADEVKYKPEPQPLEPQEDDLVNRIKYFLASAPPEKVKLLRGMFDLLVR